MEYTKEGITLLRAIGKELEILREKSRCSSMEAFASSIGMDLDEYMKCEAGKNFRIISLHRLLSHHDMDLNEFFKECYKNIQQE
jgi:hypothetical protein